MVDINDLHSWWTGLCCVFTNAYMEWWQGLTSSDSNCLVYFLNKHHQVECAGEWLWLTLLYLYYWYGKEFGKCNDRTGCCSEVWILSHTASVTGRSAVAKYEPQIVHLLSNNSVLQRSMNYKFSSFSDRRVCCREIWTQHHTIEEINQK